ncbi:MAG: HAD-IB family phosphatase [Planctomycetes bacterium]|nr:HAD-IB family phosphatase [Planctomycetota bacterium]
MPPPFAAVYFDCDSTLSAIEGVDELLAFAPPTLRAEVADLTNQAMEGTRPLAEVYETRLRLLAPRRPQLDRIGELYTARLVPDAEALVAALQALGKQVGIVSGGLLVPVQHVARHLGIPAANVHAVPLLFDDHGRYVDFDRSSPLWRNGGKIEVLGRLPAAQRPVAFVGDGVTDLETQGTADLFVGFGGVVTRPAVRDRAAAFVATPSLAPVLRHVTTPAERAALAGQARFARLLSAAEA